MKELTAAYLKGLLSYSQETGEFTWLNNRVGQSPKGSIAGSRHPGGYIYIQLNGGNYSAHRLAWLYMTGELPDRIIDHRDTEKSNNRWGNLRLCNRAENAQNRKKANSNNSTGILGVHAHGNKYKASIRVDGKLQHIGTYETTELAQAAYLARKAVVHPGALHV